MGYANIIPWGISFISVLIALVSLIRTGKKDLKENVQEFDGIKEGLIKANMKLDQVCATTNETRTDIKSLNHDLVDIERRVTIVERDLKTAFSRIAELEDDGK